MDHVLKHARNTSDPYIHALTANVLLLSDRTGDAETYLNRLKRQQTDAGFVDGARTSITQSGGTSLKIETTALFDVTRFADVAGVFQQPPRKE